MGGHGLLRLSSWLSFAKHLSLLFSIIFTRLFPYLPIMTMIGWLVVSRIYVASAIFQLYCNLEAGETNLWNRSGKTRNQTPDLLLCYTTTAPFLTITADHENQWASHVQLGQNTQTVRFPSSSQGYYPRSTRCGGDIVTLLWFRPSIRGPCEHDRQALKWTYA